MSDYVLEVVDQSNISVVVQPSPPINITISQGPQGPQGTVWLTGSGVPSNLIGRENDFYLNTVNSDVYKKISGAWVLQSNIAGQQGDTTYVGNIDGGNASSIYGGSLQIIDGGGA